MPKPICPSCGGKHLLLPGFVSFAWTRVGWRPQIETAEVADGASLHCEDCGASVVCHDLTRPDQLWLEQD